MITIIYQASAADRQYVGVLVSKLVHLVHLFLAFLETSEVVLDEKRGVELADSNLVVSGWRNDLVQQLRTCPLPYLGYHGTQLFICLVDVTWSDNIHLHKHSYTVTHQHIVLIIILCVELLILCL